MKPFLIALALAIVTTPLFPQSYNAEVIYKTTRITASVDKIITEESVRILINKRAEETRLTDVEIIRKESEKISSLEGWIEDENGIIIRKLQKKDIVESHAQTGFSFYDDYLSIKFSLRHNIYPYYLCYSYKRTTPEYLIISDWSPVLENDIPTRKSTLELIIPDGYEFNYESSGVNDPTAENLEKSKSYKWVSSYDKPVLDETCSPRLFLFFPRVKITPKQFSYGCPGTFSTWRTYGQWYSDLIKEQNILPVTELSRIHNLVKDAVSDREKISILYHYLQDNTRYINVTTDFGGHKPMPAQYVAENKYGDCKALVNYTKSMLEAVGINSFYTVVFAGNYPIESQKGIPFPNFNHVVLMIPDGNDSIWLECTSKTLPFGYSGIFTSGRKALVIDNENSAFVNTPRYSCKDVETIRNFGFKINYSGALTLDASFVLKGSDFETFLAINNSLDLKEQKKMLDKYLDHSGIEVSEYKLKRESRDDNEMLFTMTGNANKYVRKVQNEYFVSAVAFDLPEFEPPSKRKLPVLLTNPVSYKDTVTVEMLDGLIPGIIPEEVNIENEFGSYQIKIKREKNKITLIKEVCLNAGKYPLEKYPSFYSFLMSVRKAEKNCVIVATKPPAK